MAKAKGVIYNYRGAAKTGANAGMHLYDVTVLIGNRNTQRTQIASAKKRTMGSANDLGRKNDKWVFI